MDIDKRFTLVDRGTDTNGNSEVLTTTTDCPVQVSNHTGRILLKELLSLVLKAISS